MPAQSGSRKAFFNPVNNSLSQEAFRLCFSAVRRGERRHRWRGTSLQSLPVTRRRQRDRVGWNGKPRSESQLSWKCPPPVPARQPHFAAPIWFLDRLGGLRELMASIMSVRWINCRRANSRARERERHLLLYLQRLLCQERHLSRIRPSGWGKHRYCGDQLRPAPGVAFANIFQRWVAQPSRSMPSIRNICRTVAAPESKRHE